MLEECQYNLHNSIINFVCTLHVATERAAWGKTNLSPLPTGPVNQQSSIKTMGTTSGCLKTTPWLNGQLLIVEW